jgi:hypothetical protein
MNDVQLVHIKHLNTQCIITSNLKNYVKTLLPNVYYGLKPLHTTQRLFIFQVHAILYDSASLQH